MGFWVAYSGANLFHNTGEALSTIARLSGLLGTYMILWQLVLRSRINLVEKAFSVERLNWLHKWNGYIGLILILVHFIFQLIGYSIINHVNLLQQEIDFLLNYEDVLKASLALALFVGVVGMSIAIVRRHFKYETWYVVHMMTYLAIILAFGHQFNIGIDFLGHPWFVAYWYFLYAVAGGLIVVFRFGLPTYRLWYHNFKVDRIVPEATDTVSIYIGGRNIQKFNYVAGQYMAWRFLSKELWWQAHPFSLSWEPGHNQLRLTVKASGDYTAQLLQVLKPGTPVLVDGPHGLFRPVEDERPRLFVAGGIGVTPLRSMIGAGGGQGGTLIYAAHDQSSVALSKELDELAKQQGMAVHYVLEDREGRLNAELLAKLAPQAAASQVLLCGPPAMMAATTQLLRGQGVPANAIVTELFSY